MVTGLDIFREHFKDYPDKYIVIGGTACDLAMTAVGLEFRSTKDIDIVLSIETLNRDFTNAFWSFIREGGYQKKEVSERGSRFYRFKDPEKKAYPYMLELFSRTPDTIILSPDAHLTPIPTDESISSLSAILLDDTYYGFIHSGKILIEGITTVGPPHLLPLKAKAWLDLTKRKESGEKVASGDIKKHKNDVFRLFNVLEPQFNGEIPDSIKLDFSQFLSAMEIEQPNPKAVSARLPELADLINELRRIYGLVTVTTSTPSSFST